jgi:hypothetical protein
VASFLYKQDLATTKVIFWMDPGHEHGHDHHHISIFSDMARYYGVDLRTFEWDSQIHGVFLPNNTFFGNYAPHIQKIHNKELDTYSDLVRLLLCCNYGGVWLDNDAWLIQPFDDLFDAEEEFAPRFRV